MRFSHWGYSFGSVASIFVAACVPSKEFRSAGQIGCSPDEITISDDQYAFGLLQTGESWVAECHGRTFVCSQLNVTEGGRSLGAHALASEQVSCREAPESPEAQRNQARLDAARARAALPTPQGAAPTGAAGFVFGASMAEAESVCNSAGQSWSFDSRDTPRCSGAATDTGFSVSVDVRFCQGKTCAIELLHQTSAHVAERMVELKNKLEAKYGTPQEPGEPIPGECRRNADFLRCLQSGELRLHYGWRWRTGESIDLTASGTPAERAASLRISYRRDGKANLSAL